MKIQLRLTGRQHADLRRHLFPGDGLEAVSVALCGRHAGSSGDFLMVRRLVHIPYAECKIRKPHRITWSSDRFVPVLEEALKRDGAIVKFHSHPGGLASFSDIDDDSDKELFASVHGWTDTNKPHASAVMLPDGVLFGRAVLSDGRFVDLSTISVAGDDLNFWRSSAGHIKVPESATRHAQLFGDHTTELLRKLSVAVVGCSGTGGPVIEQLARLAVGCLVLVDPKKTEAKNLNRIPNTSLADAKKERLKVDVLTDAINRIGLGTEVIPIPTRLDCPRAVRAVAQCDVVIGCMDGVEGRHMLNRLASFYSIPYLDLGVKLIADGKGGIDEVCGAVHYLQPDASTLLDRHVYTMEQVRAEGLKRTNPKQYKEQLKSKYIEGVEEDRPAVVSVNTLIASTAVNELLARLHPYRYDNNREFAITRISLIQGQTYHEPEIDGEGSLAKHVGRGDVTPLLDMPELSEGGAST